MFQASRLSQKQLPLQLLKLCSKRQDVPELLKPERSIEEDETALLLRDFTDPYMLSNPV